MRLKSDDYAPNVNRIFSLTEFQRRAKEFLAMLKDTRVPLVLTVNGKAMVVVQDAPTYQEMVDRIRADNQLLRELVKSRQDSARTKELLDDLSQDFT